jgi:hypothetical protein
MHQLAVGTAVLALGWAACAAESPTWPAPVPTSQLVGAPTQQPSAESS